MTDPRGFQPPTADPGPADVARAARLAHDRLMWSAQINGYATPWEAMTADQQVGWIELMGDLLDAAHPRHHHQEGANI